MNNNLSMINPPPSGAAGFASQMMQQLAPPSYNQMMHAASSYAPQPGDGSQQQQVNAVFRAALGTDVPFAKLIAFLQAIDASGLDLKNVVDVLAHSTA